MERELDIFDKMMHLPVLRIFEPFYKKHKEVLMYLFFGGLAFFLNIFLFWGFCRLYELVLPGFPAGKAVVANVFAWVLCVLFQFFTNRTWVFDGRTATKGEFWKQMASFFGGRIFTLVVEEVILLVFINWLGCKEMIVKLVAQVVVIVLNYVVSKLFVFKEK